MENNLINGVVSILAAIVGVAVIAVLVSNKAQTGSILTAGGNAFSTAIQAAVSPITGGSGFGSLGGVDPITIH